MNHDEFILSIVNDVDSLGRVKSRERNDLEYKESFGLNSCIKYAKSMAAFANNKGGYIIFGIKDNPRSIVGVNQSFHSFKQEKFTEMLNSLFSPELEWDVGTVECGDYRIGYIYTYEAEYKPVIALKNDSSEKINGGDIFYRYRARSEKIKYPEMNRIIEERIKKERKQIMTLMEVIRKSGTTNLGIVNYNNGKFSTPYGTDITVDKKLVMQVLRKAKYIKSGSFDETNGNPVLKVTGNIDLAEEIPVPDIEPDIKYPYLQKQLSEKLGVNSYSIQALIWHYKMKGIKKYHMEVSATSSGKSKINKFSDIALQFLADKMNEHKEDKTWLDEIKQQFTQSKKHNKGKYERHK